MKPRDQLTPQKRKITIEDVAKAAGVSISTVSRVMNNNYHHMAEETKQKVLDAISALDYRPNALAKGLKQMKTNSIGLILANLQNPFWLLVLEGIEDACQEAGYSLLILNSRDDIEKEGNNVKEFLMRQLDGMIINPADGENALFNVLVDEQFPLVFLNRKVAGLNADTVVVDNVRGTTLAINHLVSLNKKKIAIFLYPTSGISPRLERIEGYKKALTEHGLEVDDSLIKIVENKDDCLEHIKQLFAGDEKPDAIFSTNNMLTLVILDALGELGIKVPEDISLLGYDETEWSKHLSPPLTTIKQPAYEMGRGAAERLIQSIKTNRQEEQWEPETIQFEPSLVVRRSCGESF
ncbi:LacI family DNA-binding transcriptional regulator [Planococcus sp. YIM B11945]|uniref:LacI family DNA-binding transcriptional regulator n=1 Tax=Planococcus sp. YIM B11945 TaxID=3435410 RepID=UPI003D7EDBE6